MSLISEGFSAMMNAELKRIEDLKNINKNILYLFDESRKLKNRVRLLQKQIKNLKKK